MGNKTKPKDRERGKAIAIERKARELREGIIRHARTRPSSEMLFRAIQAMALSTLDNIVQTPTKLFKPDGTIDMRRYRRHMRGARLVRR